MKIYRNINSLRKHIHRLKQQNQTIGFVPTMGALHEGHLSLLRKSRRENDVTILSVYVNPTQFGPNEDFTSYPRPEKKDIFLAKKENVDIIFYPSDKTMYSEEHCSFISVAVLSDRLCGRSRPGHFQGVATIVAKLLHLVSPDRLYLGQKDAQQATIVKRMILDLNFDVKIRVCPIIREKDGLALSSRNVYLNEVQRQEAPILYAALKKAKLAVKSGETNATNILEKIREIILTRTSGTVDYVACVDQTTLEPIQKITQSSLIVLAVYFGKTRLIDNIIVHPK
ncbi:MAG: pantoate--beta-alanine ligase [Candidatus Omnitrophica bacterium]|nr:pantoate--beta-alanine ligase [Candidatus Omnitrophota bacterium]